MLFVDSYTDGYKLGFRRIFVRAQMVHDIQTDRIQGNACGEDQSLIIK